MQQSQGNICFQRGPLRWLMEQKNPNFLWSLQNTQCDTMNLAITSQRKIAELFVMALIKREILTSCKVLFTKSCILNNQARIHTGFHRFTEIGQVFHNKHIFNNNSRTFQVEIWKMVCTNVFFYQFPGSRQKPGKGNFRELKPKKFSGVHPGSPRSLLPRPLV